MYWSVKDLTTLKNIEIIRKNIEFHRVVFLSGAGYSHFPKNLRKLIGDWGVSEPIEILLSRMVFRQILLTEQKNKKNSRKTSVF